MANISNEAYIRSAMIRWEKEINAWIDVVQEDFNTEPEEKMKCGWAVDNHMEDIINECVVTDDPDKELYEIISYAVEKFKPKMKKYEVWAELVDIEGELQGEGFEEFEVPENASENEVEEAAERAFHCMIDWGWRPKDE